MTRAQCVGQGKLGVWTLADQFERLLTEAGCQVTRRTPRIDDDPKDWDVVFVGVAPILGLAARFSYGAYRLLGLAREHGNLATFIDDWQHRPVLSNLRTIIKHPEYLASRTIQAKRPDSAWAVENEAWCLELANKLLTEPWPNHVWNAFACTGGHPEYLTGREDNAIVWAGATWVDPSCTVRDDLGAEPIVGWAHASRRKQWVHAQMLKQETTWLLKLKAATAWEVCQVGVDIDKLKEPNLVREIYASSTGIIANPYSHRGSGCWRARYIHGALTGAIVLGHPEEMRGLPAFNRTAAEYEAMSPFELAEAADWQRSTLRDGAWTRGRLREELLNAIR